MYYPLINARGIFNVNNCKISSQIISSFYLLLVWFAKSVQNSYETYKTSVVSETLIYLFARLLHVSATLSQNLKVLLAFPIEKMTGWFLILV